MFCGPSVMRFEVYMLHTATTETCSWANSHLSNTGECRQYCCCVCMSQQPPSLHVHMFCTVEAPCCRASWTDQRLLTSCLTSTIVDRGVKLAGSYNHQPNTTSRLSTNQHGRTGAYPSGCALSAESTLMQCLPDWPDRLLTSC